MAKLNPGDRWLNVVVTLGDVDFTFPAFLNTEATPENKQPRFKGKNVAVWINTKKENKPAEEIV